jgi:hypothetical protein
MHTLNQIFPVDYPNTPTTEELLFEVQDLLRHSMNPFDIMHYINDIACPYYRKALAILVPPKWHSMEQEGKEPAIFEDLDGYRRITWINIESDIGRIVKKANAEQVDLENQTPNYSRLSTTTDTQPSTPNASTMPLFINKHEGIINHNEYHNCTIYQGVATPQNATEAPPTDSSQPIAPSLLCLDRHSVSVIERKMNEALDVPTKTKACANLYALQREGYINLDQYRSDEERAQALNRYQTTHVFCADDLQRGRSKR